MIHRRNGFVVARPAGIVRVRIQAPQLIADLHRVTYKLYDYDAIEPMIERLRDDAEILVVRFPRRKGDDNAGFLEAQGLEVARVKEVLAERRADASPEDLEYLLWLLGSAELFNEELRMAKQGNAFEGLFVNCFLVDIWKLFAREIRSVVSHAEQTCGV